MIRQGKASEGTGAMLISLAFVVYIGSLRSSTNAETTPTLPTEWDIKEAQRIVAKYIKEEVDGPWLMNLMQSNSEPLKMTDLVKAILRDTNKGEKVWQAATILGDTLNSEGSMGSRMDLNTGLIDNWNDLIAKVETENDIICLYRKSANETTKRDEDWRKFLRTVSPGYTIHFAIDAGRKYIICLKRVELPETMMDEISTERETSTTWPTEAAAETTSRAGVIEDETPTTAASSVVHDSLRDEVSSAQFEAEKQSRKKERFRLKNCDDVQGGSVKKFDIGEGTSCFDTSFDEAFVLTVSDDWKRKIHGTRFADYSESSEPETTSENVAPPAGCRQAILILVPKNKEFSATPEYSSSVPRLVKVDAMPKVNFNRDQPNGSTDVRQSVASKKMHYPPNVSPRRWKTQPIAERASRTIPRKPRVQIFRPRSRRVDSVRGRSDRAGDAKYRIGKRGEYFTKPVWKSNVDRHSLLSTTTSDRIPPVSDHDAHVNLLRSNREPNGESILAYETSKPLQPRIIRPERPWDYHKLPSRGLSIGKGASGEKNSPSSSRWYDRFDHKLIDPLKSRQTTSRFFSCGRFHPGTNYQDENNLRPRAVEPRISAYRFYPVCSSDRAAANNGIDNRWNDRTSGFSSSSKACCDRPIKLKVVISGKVRQPFGVTSSPEPEKKWQMSEPVDPDAIHDSRERESDSVVKNRLDAMKEILRPVIGLRMDMKNTSEEQSSMANMIDGTSTRGDESNSTMGNKMESSSGRPKIVTSEKNEASETVSTTINPAIVI